MNKLFTMAVVITIAITTVALMSCKDRKGDCKHKHDKSAKALDIKTDQKKCPVMSEKIDKKYHVVHKGKVVFFCCKACIKKFKENPEKYMKKLKGVKLPDAPKDSKKDNKKKA